MDKYHTLNHLAAATEHQLTQIKGVGIPQAARIKAATRLGRRQIKAHYEYQNKRLLTTKAAAEIIRARIGPETREVMILLTLDGDLREIDWSSAFFWQFSGALLVVAVAGKVAGVYLINVSWAARWVIGLSMIPRGEVGLIFAELGRVSGIFNNDIYAGMILVIALTTLVPPFALKWFYDHYGHRLQAAN